MSAYEVSLSVSGTRAAIAWHGGETGRSAIYFAWLNPDGRPNIAPARVTDGSQDAFEPDLQLLGDVPFVAWYEKEPKTGALTAWLGRLDSNGKIGRRVRLDGGGGQARNPVLRIVNDTVHSAWIETASTPEQYTAVWTESFDLGGQATGMARRAGLASHDTWNLNATVDRQGIFYVVYDASLSGRAKELQILAIGDSTVKHRQLSSDDDHKSVYPDIGISPGGRAALTWFDDRDGNEEVYLAIMPLDDLMAGVPLPSRRISRTAAPSIGAYLAWNGDRLALTWCDAESGQQELYAQFFGTGGEPKSGIVRLTRTATQSSIPSIRASKSGFLVGWNEYRSNSENRHEDISGSVAMTTRLE